MEEFKGKNTYFVKEWLVRQGLSKPKCMNLTFFKFHDPNSLPCLIQSILSLVHIAQLTSPFNIQNIHHKFIHAQHNKCKVCFSNSQSAKHFSLGGVYMGLACNGNLSLKKFKCLGVACGRGC